MHQKIYFVKQMFYIMILFHKGSTVKDESNQNIMFLCQVLNNIDFPLKEKLIRSKSI